MTIRNFLKRTSDNKGLDAGPRECYTYGPSDRFKTQDYTDTIMTVKKVKLCARIHFYNIRRQHNKTNGNTQNLT